MHKLNRDNVADTLVLAHLHREPLLEMKCADVIRDNVRHVQATQGWGIIEREHPGIMTKLLLSLNEK